MKTTRIYLISLLIICGGFTACNNWLDVEADSRVTQEDLFKDYTGYRSALNGIYRLLGAPELYARDLTWGMTSVLGYNYQTDDLPEPYRFIEQGEYDHVDAEKIISNVWRQGYRVIANCNNLIAQTEKQDTSFFLEGKVEHDLILGESKGVRALIHFDLLRLFAPAPVVDDARVYMPYVARYPDPQPRYMTVSAVLDSIINDLEYAKTNLAYHDTLYNIYSIYDISYRFNNGNTLIKGGSFFFLRGLRMNYFAASALLARAYLYKGDKQNALRCANDVYQFASRKTWFKFTASTNLETSNVNAIYRKMYDDIIFAGMNNRMYDLYDNARVSNIYFFFYRNLDHLFEGDKDDFRSTRLIEPDGSSRRWKKPEANQNVYPTSWVIQYQGPIAPVIRLSEIYYIMCECLIDTDLPKAINLLSTVRVARGAKTPLDPAMSKSTFLGLLYKEFTRESMSEGQTFFLYKRLNAPMYNGEYPVDMGDRYVLPLPYGETAYSNL